MTRRGWIDLRNGLLFCSPIIVGLLWFTAYPILASLYYSFHDYNALQPPEWVGLENYRELFFYDDKFWYTLYNTLYYVAGAVPLGVAFAFFLASLLNMRVGGLAYYRTIFFLPSIVPVVATSILWLWIFNPQYGIANTILAYLGIVGPGWISDPSWSKPSLIIMSLWTVGQTIVVFLAGLQDVPQELYEAAQLDGANTWQRTWNITVPFMSPYLLFSTITGLIFGFQYFTQVFIMTRGGPAFSSTVYSMYLYLNAFEYFKMGYASAMAWILFVIVSTTSFLIFRSTARRVYYGGQ
jgi:multiple sugar transport system permease protein